jgi:hypothetical protein
MKTFFYNAHYKFPTVKLNRVRKPRYQGIVNLVKKKVIPDPELFTIEKR